MSPDSALDRGRPDPAPARVAVIADSHLGGMGQGDDETDRFLAQLRALPGQGCRRLVLLGDIFHVWVASPRYETREVARVLPELRRLRREHGLHVDYIEGNRDFFVAGSPYADAFDHVGTEVSFQAGGRRVLAVHGDGLNDRDRQYLFWRWLSKSALSRLLITRLPRPLAHRLVRDTEAKLARTNFKHRKRIPEEAIRGYAERRLAEGHDTLVLGHFHEPRIWSVEGGEARLYEAWFSSRRVEWVGEEASHRSVLGGEPEVEGA